jgi:hypothetical protein
MGEIPVPGPEKVRGECPYCRKGVEFILHGPDLFVADRDGKTRPYVSPQAAALLKRHCRIRTYTCPLCDGLCVDLVKRTYVFGGDPTEEVTSLYPQSVVHEPPPEVTNPEIRRDYREAHDIHRLSVRGAAALARRALQHALREKGFTDPSKKLMKEIEAAESDPKMPSTLVEKLDFLRKVANDAAHPNYDRAGEIVDVTEDEVVMLLETLDEFFDQFYVKLARHKAIMDARHSRLKRDPSEGA